MGRNNWAESFQKSRSRLNPRDPTRSPNLGWSNPTQKTGSSGSNTISTLSLASTGRKGETDTRTGVSEKWKGVRSIRNDEMAERRAKGLCFKCGGKYHPTLHKCPERALRVLILGEGEALNDEGEIMAMEAVQPDSEEEIEVECKSMGVLGSMGEHRTMKIEGKIENVDVLVLIDSGASHNFISPQVTTALGLTITVGVAKHIKLGDGHKVVSEGVCYGLNLREFATGSTSNWDLLGCLSLVINLVCKSQKW